MIAVVVLFKDQAKYMQGIERAILAQTHAPDHVVFAVDRCPEDYEEAQRIVAKHGWSCVHANTDMPDAGVLIGRTRDAALRMLPKDMSVIFTDGDCIPSERLVEHHAQYILQQGLVATTGYRVSQREDGTWEEDIRSTRLPYKATTFSRKADRLILGRAAESTMVLFGCNMGISSDALAFIRKRTQDVFGEDRVFASIFDGEWGFEETSIGPVLYAAGARLITLSPNISQVSHAWHPSRGAGVRGSDASVTYIDKMRETAVEIVTTGKAAKKRSSEWVRSCVGASGLPSWWNEVFPNLSEREQAQVACVLYSTARESTTEVIAQPSDESRVQSAIEMAYGGVDIPSGAKIQEGVTVEPSRFGAVNSNAENVSVIIPVHNQAENICAIFDALSAQSVIPHEYIVVADRCIDTSVSAVIGNAVKLKTRLTLVHRRIDEPGFRAGQVRNLGAEHATQDRLLFLDGDCVPCPTWIEAHMAALDEAGDTPAASFGLRKDQRAKGSEEFRNDTRTYRSMIPIFWVGKNAPVMVKGPVVSHMTTWSCNLGLNKAARDILVKLNGAVFSNELTKGIWGGEDTYLGMQLWDNNSVLIAVDPEPGHVKHLWHPRQTESALGEVNKLTHEKVVTSFGLSSADLSNTTENNLARSAAAHRVPGVYKLIEQEALSRSPNEEITKRALAYMCARALEFRPIRSVSTSQVAADSMYEEIIRVQEILARKAYPVKDIAEALQSSVSVSFQPVTEKDLILCPKCKTYMRAYKSSSRCPMCRSPYTE